jgi:hypothetical protein
MVMAANPARQQARLNPDLPLVMMTDDRKADWARPPVAAWQCDVCARDTTARGPGGTIKEPATP